MSAGPRSQGSLTVSPLVSDEGWEAPPCEDGDAMVVEDVRALGLFLGLVLIVVGATVVRRA